MDLLWTSGAQSEIINLSSGALLSESTSRPNVTSLVKIGIVSEGPPTGSQVSQEPQEEAVLCLSCCIVRAYQQVARTMLTLRCHHLGHDVLAGAGRGRMRVQTGTELLGTQLYLRKSVER